MNAMIINRETMRAARVKKGWSQTDAAVKCGVRGGAQSWSSMETGRKLMVMADSLYYIAKGLGVTMESLLTRSVEPRGHRLPQDEAQPAAAT